MILQCDGSIAVYGQISTLEDVHLIRLAFEQWPAIRENAVRVIIEHSKALPDDLLEFFLDLVRCGVSVALVIKDALCRAACEAATRGKITVLPE